MPLTRQDVKDRSYYRAEPKPIGKQTGQFQLAFETCRGSEPRASAISAGARSFSEQMGQSARNLRMLEVLLRGRTTLTESYRHMKPHPQLPEVAVCGRAVTAGVRRDWNAGWAKVRIPHDKHAGNLPMVDLDVRGFTANGTEVLFDSTA